MSNEPQFYVFASFTYYPNGGTADVRKVCISIEEALAWCNAETYDCYEIVTIRDNELWLVAEKLYEKEWDYTEERVKGVE